MSISTIVTISEVLAVLGVIMLAISMIGFCVQNEKIAANFALICCVLLLISGSLKFGFHSQKWDREVERRNEKMDSFVEEVLHIDVEEN